MTLVIHITAAHQSRVTNICSSKGPPLLLLMSHRDRSPHIGTEHILCIKERKRKPCRCLLMKVTPCFQNKVRGRVLMLYEGGQKC